MTGPRIDLHAILQRRERLIAHMNALGGGVAVIATAPEQVRNADNLYPYRYDSSFFYLSGFAEPEALMVLIAGAQPRSILFCRGKHEESEIWDGFRHGPATAALAFGFDVAYPVEDIDTALPGLLADQPNLFCNIGRDPAFDARVRQWLNGVRANARTGVLAPASLRDVRPLIDEMRLFKDSGEIATMRAAATISVDAHVRAMRATRPGRHEYEIEAELLYEFRRRGAQAPAYSPIVASGAATCTLHYVDNDAMLADGDLLLIDAGCELDGYAADITRTFPVNGRFSGPQRAVYEIVLAAQDAAIAATAPGQCYNASHDAATAVLVQGMIDLGLLHGSLDGVLESGAWRRFFMHRTGHWLGMDVHDAGDYRARAEHGDAATTTLTIERPWRTLREGMVVTIEPGLYVRAADDVPQAFWNVGVRIEDDALVTATGSDILSAAAPRRIDDIEALMRA